MNAVPGGSKMKILHTLAKSYPALNGYSVRSHEILRAQNSHPGVESIGLTSPYYAGIYGEGLDEKIDGVQYVRTHDNHAPESMGPSERKIMIKNRFFLWRILSRLSYPLKLFSMYRKEKLLINLFQRRIEQVSNTMKPDVIHAHTPFKVGLPSMNVAKLHKIPFIYEVRGIWEDSAVARGTYNRLGLRYFRFRRMENKVMRGADRIFCLTEEIKSNIISRGIPEEKISVMPNAAPSRFLVSQDFSVNDVVDGDLTMIRNFKSVSKMIGYVGSTEGYEGLDLIIKSLERLKKEGIKIKFLVISNNKNHDSLNKFCEGKKIKDDVLIVGPIERTELRKYYSLLDGVVVPRYADSKMAQTVTPLKQMEALALGIPLLITNIPAITRIIGSGTATTFRSGDIEDLSRKIVQIVSGSDDVLLRVQAGKLWIKNNANWDIVAKRGLAVYDSIV